MSENKKPTNEAKKEKTGGDTYNINNYGVYNTGDSNDNHDNNRDNAFIFNGDKLSPEELEQFADWLRKERKEKKMTQKDVADKSGIDLKYYQKLESKKIAIEPRLSTVKRLAKFFGHEGISLSTTEGKGHASSIIQAN